MKKLLLASAVAALSVSAAHAAPTVYGKAFLTVDYIDFGDDSSTKLNSNSSRIGFKGSEALTADTDVVYKLEYGINIDDDNSIAYDENLNKLSNSKDQFYSRDTYLGLSNAQYGTLIAGRMTTIDDYVDFADVTEGKNIGYVGPAFDEPRADNAFAYMSPDYNGVQFLAMYGLDSDQDKGSLDNEEQYGIGATYTTGPMNVGATYIGHGDNSHARVSGNYQLTPELVLGALYQLSDYDSDDNENTLMLSAEMQTSTPWTTYGQVSMVDNIEGVSDYEALGFAVGGKYSFRKNAIGHVYAGYADYDDGEESEDGFSIGTGLEYKF